MSLPHYRPRTYAELMALPLGPKFGVKEVTVDGRTVRVPVMERTPVAIFHDKDDPVSWVDADGAWTIGRYSDGTWFKQRR